MKKPALVVTSHFIKPVDALTTKRRRDRHANDYNQRRYTDLLQGLGS
jgi:hypothetical protein